MSIKGFDVASFQHPNGDPIDFAKAHAAGYQFAYVKATEGVGYINPYFVRDIHAAKQAGLAVGAYTFMRRDTDAVAAGNKLHEVLSQSGVHLDLPVAMDFEPHPDGSAPTHQQLDTLRTVLRQHGYHTITYSFAPFVKAHIPADCAWCAKDPLWLAAYQTKAPDAPKPWGKVTIWQNYDKATVPGVHSTADDADVFLGTQSAFDVFIGRHAPAPELPAWYHRLLEYPPSKLRDPGHTVVKDGQRFQEGDDVKHVQRRLGIKPDGLFGPITANHVKGLQKLHKLTPDGVVGPKTAKAIG